MFSPVSGLLFVLRVLQTTHSDWFLLRIANCLYYRAVNIYILIPSAIADWWRIAAPHMGSDCWVAVLGGVEFVNKPSLLEQLGWP